MSFEDYRKLDAYGASDILTFRRGPPCMVPWRRQHPEDSEYSILGSACHMAILQPELFDQTYCFKPEGMTFATKEGKAWREDHKRYEILPADARGIVAGVREAFMENHECQKALQLAQAIEGTVLWRDRDLAITCRSRPDFWTPEHSYDLKITLAATKPQPVHKFEAHKWGWSTQAAMAREGLRRNGVRIKTSRLILIASEPPHSPRVWLYELSENDADFLWLGVRKTLTEMQPCHVSHHWPGAPETWQPLDLTDRDGFEQGDERDLEDLDEKALAARDAEVLGG